MDLRLFGVVMYLYLGLPCGSGNVPTITKFTSISEDRHCEHFTKPQMTEDKWNKGNAKGDISVGPTTKQPVHIAQIHLDVGKDYNEHVVRLCTIDCRQSNVEITGYTINTVGSSGVAIVFTELSNTKQLTFSAQATQKSHGFKFNINVWGKTEPGNPAILPNAVCINPRAIKDSLDKYCN